MGDADGWPRQSTYSGGHAGGSATLARAADRLRQANTAFSVTIRFMVSLHLKQRFSFRPIQDADKAMINDDVEELFAAVGPVTVRRMFGGRGVYHQGRMVAAEIGGVLRLKADAISAPAFEAAGAEQWIYQRPGGKPVAMPYWTVPDAALDDPDAMATWAKLAWEAALRAPEKAKRRG